MTDTKGLQALKEFLGEDRSQGWLARTLGVSQPTVSAWLRGITRPEPELRKALASIAEIPEDDWLTDEERERVDRAQSNFAASIGTDR